MILKSNLLILACHATNKLNMHVFNSELTREYCLGIPWQDGVSRYQNLTEAVEPTQDVG